MNKVASLIFFLLFAQVGYCATPLDGTSVSAMNTQEAIQRDIPYRRDDPVTTSLIVRVVGSLVLVLAMAAGIIYILKRYMPGWRIGVSDKSSRITVLEIKRLTPRTFLFLVQVDGKTLLLAQSNDRVTALNLMESATPASGAAARNGP